MSNMNLMQDYNIVDDCQRVSCNRAASASATAAIAGRCVISKDFVLGCRAERNEPYESWMFEPTWCVYMRAKDDVDMGAYIKRVTFRMSPRLPLRLHVADTSPFEITEVLATDFPIEMQIQYVDDKMTPTSYVFKPSMLHAASYNVDDCHDFVLDELNDRMIFVNPSLIMKQRLTTPTPQPKLVELPLAWRHKQPSLPAAPPQPKKKAKKTSAKAAPPVQPEPILGRLSIRGPGLSALTHKRAVGALLR